jgi:hypothetical protein
MTGWTVGNEGYNADKIYDGGDAVAEVFGIPINHRIEAVPATSGEALARAHLIAAAPDMALAIPEAVTALRMAAATIRSGKALPREERGDMSDELLHRARCLERALRKSKGDQ